MAQETRRAAVSHACDKGEGGTWAQEQDRLQCDTRM